jgi:hypothetical protein
VASHRISPTLVIDRLEELVVELLKIVAETNWIKDRFRELVREKKAEELFT